MKNPRWSSVWENIRIKQKQFNTYLSVKIMAHLSYMYLSFITLYLQVGEPRSRSQRCQWFLEMADRDETAGFGRWACWDRASTPTGQAQSWGGNPGATRSHTGKQTESQKHERRGKVLCNRNKGIIFWISLMLTYINNSWPDMN